MNNRDRFAIARFTRPEREYSLAGEFLFCLGLFLLAVVILAGVLL